MPGGGRPIAPVEGDAGAAARPHRGGGRDLVVEDGDGPAPGADRVDARRERRGPSLPRDEADDVRQTGPEGAVDEAGDVRCRVLEDPGIGRRLVHRDLADRCSGSCASCDLVTCNAPPVTVPVVKPGEVRVLFGFLLALYTGAWIGLVSAALSFIT